MHILDRSTPKNCRLCGTSYKGDFCPTCGYDDLRDVVCPKCGKSFDPDFDKCPYCGYAESVDSSEVVLSSGYDANKERPYVKCVNVYIQKVVLSCIAFCLFFALFIMMFAGFLRISPERRIVAYIVLTVIFAVLFFASLIIHISRVFVARNRGIKNLKDSYLFTSVYVFMGIIGTCFICGCAFWISDLASTIGKFPLYGFIVYSVLALAGILYGVRVILSVMGLRPILFGSNNYAGKPLRIADENLSTESYVYYLEYERELKRSKFKADDGENVSGDIEDTAKTKIHLTIRAKILYMALLTVVLMAVIMFFVIRGVASLFNVDRLIGGYYQGSDIERVHEFLDYDVDYYIDVLGPPDKGTDSALYWYGNVNRKTCGFIMVTFEEVDGENTVTSVLLDKKHVYDETDDFSTKAKKANDLVLTNSSLVLHYLAGQGMDLSYLGMEDMPRYAVKYSDGSFYTSYLTSFSLKDGDVASGEIEWMDDLGTYTADASVVWRSITDEDGILVNWLVNDGVIDVPEWAVDISDDALDGVTYINEVTLPDGITSFVIPSSVTYVGEGAFKACTSLETVIVECETTYANMFADCDSLETVVFGDGVREIADYTLCDLASLGSVTIGEFVTSIGYAAFRGCSSLTEITIPESVTAIGNEAFADCSSLERIYYNADYCANLFSENNVFRMAGSGGTGITMTIGESVTRIPSYLFNPCGDALLSPKITDVIFGTGSVCSSVGAYAFMYCEDLANVSFSDSLASIGMYSFGYCTSLASVELPDGLIEIGSHAFYGCSALETLYIPDDTSSIGSYAFYGCSSLKAINIPTNLTVIDSYTFYECTSLASLTIPEGITEICDYAFYRCTALEEIQYYAVETAYLFTQNNIFCMAGQDGDGIIVTVGADVKSVPANLFYSYNVASAPRITTIVFEMGSVCSSIGDGAFYGCEFLADIELPESLVSIGRQSFSYCSSLASITIPEGVTAIGDEAFYGCTGLIEVRNLSALDIFVGSTSYGYVAYYAENVYTTYGTTSPLLSYETYCLAEPCRVSSKTYGDKNG